MKSLLFLGLCFSAIVQSSSPKVCEFFPPQINSNKNVHSNNDRDPAKYISFQNFYLQMQNNPKYFFVVDVRSEKAFAAYNIKNSYHFNGQSILVNSQLHGNNVVLVGDGASYSRLEKLYDNMLISGFKSVKILDGGVTYYRNQLIPDIPLPQAAQLTHMDFIFSEDVNQWLIQDYADVKSDPKELFVGRYYVADSDTKPSSFKGIAKGGEEFIKNILLVVDGFKYELLSEWQKSVNGNVFMVNSKSFNASLNRWHLRRQVQQRKQRTDGVEYACD